MREKSKNTHILIERQLRIYQRERSALWQCAFNVDGRWQRTSTNERELAKAKKTAHDILVKANVKKELNIAPITRKLKDVANVVLKQLEKETKSSTAKPIFKDYIAILKNYIMAFPRFCRQLILSTMSRGSDHETNPIYGGVQIRGC